MKEVRKNLRISKRLNQAIENYCKDHGVQFSDYTRAMWMKKVNLREDKTK